MIKLVKLAGALRFDYNNGYSLAEVVIQLARQGLKTALRRSYTCRHLQGARIKPKLLIVRLCRTEIVCCALVQNYLYFE